MSFGRICILCSMRVSCDASYALIMILSLLVSSFPINLGWFNIPEDLSLCVQTQGTRQIIYQRASMEFLLFLSKPTHVPSAFFDPGARFYIYQPLLLFSMPRTVPISFTLRWCHFNQESPCQSYTALPVPPLSGDPGPFGGRTKAW